MKKQQWWLDIVTWVLLPGLTSFIGLCLISILSILDIGGSSGEDPLLLGGITIGMSAIFMAFQSFVIKTPPITTSSWLVLMSFGGFATTFVLGILGLASAASLPGMKEWYVLSLIVFFLADTSWVAGCYIKATRKVVLEEGRLEKQIQKIGAPQQ